VDHCAGFANARKPYRSSECGRGEADYSASVRGGKPSETYSGPFKRDRGPMPNISARCRSTRHSWKSSQPQHFDRVQVVNGLVPGRSPLRYAGNMSARSFTLAPLGLNSENDDDATSGSIFWSCGIVGLSVDDYESNLRLARLIDVILTPDAPNAGLR
jgi:hypothetical protein